MGLPETVEFARNFAVMVRVQGPDPKGLKMRNHAFHLYNSGKTTLSASGMLLPNTLLAVSFGGMGDNDALVVTIASVVESFLSAKHRQGIYEGQPELIPCAKIDIMIEDNSMENNRDNPEELPHRWIPANLLALIDLPLSSHAVQSLIDASSGSAQSGWEYGWSLALDDNASQTIADVVKMKNALSEMMAIFHRATRYSMNSQRHSTDSLNPILVSKSITRVAILAVPNAIAKDLLDLAISKSNKKGDLLLTLGSPFGVLSPVHFFNSIAKGSIANCYPPVSSTSLLMADMRSLPGMEGGPVFNEQSHLVGILAKPLRQKGTGAEIQLVVPWEAVAFACGNLLPEGPRDARHKIDKFSGIHPPSAVDRAVSSVCLITLNDGAWASGVLLNKKGLILTNAHLLEPWRFGKSTTNEREKFLSDSYADISEKFASHYPERFGTSPRQGSLYIEMDTAESFSSDKLFKYRSTMNYRGYGNIRVRLDYKDPSIWCDASVVHISKGPLDVALLQIEFVPVDLCPVKVDLVCPSPGTKAYVIGHGLFGPRCNTYPTVSHGVVTKVVKAKMRRAYQTNAEESTLGTCPAMLETTASVHPGGSGGAIVDSDAYMIALVISNARHGGGTVIPHLNFSIPCTVLAPVFKLSKDMQDFSILHDLDKPSKDLSSVWALMPPLSPKPDPTPALTKLLPEDNNKEVRGSRFARFISERQGLLKNSARHETTKTLSDKSIQLRSRL